MPEVQVLGAGRGGAGEADIAGVTDHGRVVLLSSKTVAGRVEVELAPKTMALYSPTALGYGGGAKGGKRQNWPSLG